MFKKISVVLCAGLFATAFAAGCKKDKGGDGAAAATCDGVAAKIAKHMSEESGAADMKDAPPEMKKAMEEAMKKVPAAIAGVCKADKWSQEALDCAAKAKDPKEECEGKLTPEQEKNLGMAAMSAMGMGDMGGMMHDDKVDDQGTVGVVAAGSDQGSAAGSGTAAAPVAAGTFPATCEGVAARAASDMTKNMPPGMPAEVPAKFATMLAKVCTDDKWAQDVIDCGVTAADPKEECKDKLTADQKAHVDAEQEKMAKEMMEQMAAEGDGAGAGGGMAAGGSSGIKECDEFMEAVKKIAACDKLPADQKAGMEQMAGAFGALNSLPEDQKAQYAEQCKQGITGMAELAKAYGC